MLKCHIAPCVKIIQKVRFMQCLMEYAIRNIGTFSLQEELFWVQFVTNNHKLPTVATLVVA
jgi:hypothetical protein